MGCGCDVQAQVVRQAPLGLVTVQRRWLSIGTGHARMCVAIIVMQPPAITTQSSL